MRWYHMAAFVGLFLFQSAPTPTGESLRKYGLSAMVGAGQYEYATFDCDGNLVSSEEFRTRDAGVRFDAMLPDSRLHTTVSWSRSSAGGLPTRSILTARIAIEGEHVGAGLGIMAGPVDGELPSLYLRIGHAAKQHFLMEVAPPSETYFATGVVRTGIGFKSGMVGIMFGPDGQTSATGDFAIRASPAFEVLLRSHFGPGHENQNAGLAVGARYRF